MDKLRTEALKVNVSLACFPGLRHEVAAKVAHEGVMSGSLFEPGVGRLVCEHVQLVPQNMGCLTEDTALGLKELYPSTRFRLHANVRVLRQHVLADLSNFDDYGEWFAHAARVNTLLGSHGYSAHSGRRREATMGQVLENTRRAADLFGCPVSIEGQYPSHNDDYLVSSWEEYRQVLDSGVPFALDLSHLNIVAHRSRRREDSLVREMLASSACLEVHVSDNDGRGDQHRTCEQMPWWSALLESINPDAVIFSEGNHRFRIDPHRKDTSQEPSVN